MQSSYLRKSIKNSSSKSINDKYIDKHDDDLIDQHLFIEAIALCAFEVQYSSSQPSPIEKVKIF